MSECHKMRRMGTYPDGTETWTCPSGCDITWMVEPQEKGPPKILERDGSSDDHCHSFGYEVKPDDLMLGARIGDE